MKLYERIIPKNSSTSYISGWEALNISDENRNTADWHPRTYLFSYDKDKAINLYNTTNVLGNSGIKKRIIILLQSLLKVKKRKRNRDLKMKTRPLSQILNENKKRKQRKNDVLKKQINCSKVPNMR